MSGLIASSLNTAIVGAGVTGLSVARFLARQQTVFTLFDTRLAPPSLAELHKIAPDAPVVLGDLSDDAFLSFHRVVLSPGVARSLPAVARAIAEGIEVIGDIELFARGALAPIVAITGSNGKTTVTSLVGQMAKDAGINVKVGGNLGTPALDLLEDNVELYVLELSSFQLESTHRLNAEVATVLNVTPDHMDRYDSIQQYWSAKQKIYWGAKKLVVNRDDALTQFPAANDKQYLSFGSRSPDLNQYGLITKGHETFIARGTEVLISMKDTALCGSHNALNIQAALAIGEHLGLDRAQMLNCVKNFKGLPHRCQFVARKDGVDFINDSKGTNVGATVAAIAGLAAGKNVILIAGGDAKGAEFTELGGPAERHLKALIAIGVDGPKLIQTLAQCTQTHSAETLQKAVTLADQIKAPGDIVLLSPACASFDMFKNYEDRGAQFVACVEALCA